ncbi:hypothetical protein MMC13_005275 [Lambiella insularis]|nr:hypothetical protein [Lambiella insularis]
MAQKAAKQQASRNSAILKRIHLTSLALNSLFILFRFFLFRSSCTRLTYVSYFVLSAPAFVIEFWLEKVGRPTNGPNGELKNSGQDLEAKGLTEYMLDILYWSWGTACLVMFSGDKAWWMWAAIPLYSVWLALSTFGNVKQSMAGLAGQGGEGDANGGSMSNRQRKLEKRGGQKMQYR